MPYFPYFLELFSIGDAQPVAAIAEEGRGRAQTMKQIILQFFRLIAGNFPFKATFCV